MRSPTFFEDVIKTVTSCNVTWPSTVTMNRRLCEVVGRGGAFPTPKRIARTRPATLRARCRVGYRDARIIELARMFASREIEPEWFEDPATPDDALWDRLLDLPGIGPYAAANIMQLLGRYHRLPLDSESLRHGKTVMGLKGTDRAIMKRMHKHFEPFGRHAFRSYWFELWAFYESKQGPSWGWDRQATASAFTASQFK
jgi:3-methyladenine DNA glycosylase/8-oxoguanine DNA glycosylase